MKTHRRTPGLLLGLCFALPLSAETVTIVETTNGQVSRHNNTFTRSESAGQRVDTVVTPEGTTTRTFDAQGGLRSAEWTGAAGHYTLTAEGNGVKAAGLYRGKPVTGTVDLKGRLWDRGGGEMDFTVAYRALVRQGFSGTVTLVTIAPDDVAHPVEMAFSKEAVEVIGGRTTVRVRLGLSGVFALLWSGQAWVDPVTGDQLRLKSNKGPGTPETLYVTENVQ